MKELEAGAARGRKRGETITGLIQSYHCSDEEFEARIAYATETEIRRSLIYRGMGTMLPFRVEQIHISLDLKNCEKITPDVKSQ